MNTSPALISRHSTKLNRRTGRRLEIIRSTLACTIVSSLFCVLPQVCLAGVETFTMPAADQDIATHDQLRNKLMLIAEGRDPDSGNLITRVANFPVRAGVVAGKIISGDPAITRAEPQLEPPMEQLRDSPDGFHLYGQDFEDAAIHAAIFGQKGNFRAAVAILQGTSYFNNKEHQSMFYRQIESAAIEAGAQGNRNLPYLLSLVEQGPDYGAPGHKQQFEAELSGAVKQAEAERQAPKPEVAHLDPGGLAFRVQEAKDSASLRRDPKNEPDYTALHVAVQDDRNPSAVEQTVQALLAEPGAAQDLKKTIRGDDLTDPRGLTPLARAIFSRNLGATKLLADYMSSPKNQAQNFQLSVNSFLLQDLLSMEVEDAQKPRSQQIDPNLSVLSEVIGLANPADLRKPMMEGIDPISILSDAAKSAKNFEFFYPAQKARLTAVRALLEKRAQQLGIADQDGPVTASNLPDSLNTHGPNTDGKLGQQGGSSAGSGKSESSAGLP